MKTTIVVSTPGSRWVIMGVEHHFCGRCDYEVWPTMRFCKRCGEYITWPQKEAQHAKDKQTDDPRKDSSY